MPRRAERTPEELREHLLDAAESMLVANGYGSLTARRIASAAGCAPGMIYVAFDNLDSLVVQLNVRTLDRLFEHIAGVTGTELRGLDDLLAVAHAYLAFAVENTAAWRTVFEHPLPPEEEIPESFNERVARLFDLVEGPIADLVPGLSREAAQRAARAMWSGVHGVCVLSLTGKLFEESAGTTGQLIDSLVTNYLLGLRQETRERRV